MNFPKHDGRGDQFSLRLQIWKQCFWRLETKRTLFIYLPPLPWWLKLRHKLFLVAISGYCYSYSHFCCFIFLSFCQDIWILLWQFEEHVLAWRWVWIWTRASSFFIGVKENSIPVELTWKHWSVRFNESCYFELQFFDCWSGCFAQTRIWVVCYCVCW